MIVFILKSLNNGKYYTGRFWDTNNEWTTDPEQAKEYNNREEINDDLTSEHGDDGETNDNYEILSEYSPYKIEEIAKIN